VDSDFYSGRAVLVTGAGGFTGSHLANRLADLGAHVRAFVRTGGSRRSLRDDIALFSGDLRDADDCRRAVDGIDTVFHVAAVFRRLNGGDAEVRAVHVKATEHLVRGAAAAGCRRFVHTSTMGVHGSVQDPPGNEDSPFSPGDSYQDTKLEGEQLARNLAQELGLPITVLRPCGIYGPGDTRFLKMVQPIQKGRFVMLGPGDVHYHFVHVEDLVQGLLLAGEKENAVGGTYLIGGAQSISLNYLAKLIAAKLGVNPPWPRLPVGPIMAAGWMCE